MTHREKLVFLIQRLQEDSPYKGMEIPEDFIIRINMGLEIRCPEEYVMHKVYAVSF